LQALHRNAPSTDARETLSVAHLKSGTRLVDASLALRQGEVLGLAGLLGSGRTELARCMFGADRIDAGNMRVGGGETALRSPADAIGRGIAYLSEDRKMEGIIPDQSVLENLTLVVLTRLARAGIVDRAAQRALVERFVARLGIRCSGPGQPIRELSGGNQQKVMLARWLAARSDVLLLDEPTRGIDVGAKAEILSLLRELSGTGVSVLLIASELEELVAASDRVVVLREGRTVRELQGDSISESEAMAAMAQGNAGAPAAADA
jgi:monosaccharide-transporting ATPase